MTEGNEGVQPSETDETQHATVEPPTVASSTSAGTEPSAESVEAAQRQYEEDLAWKTEHPNEPLIRGGNSEVGGEV